ncbi:MAG: type I restriction endonuclease subunit R [Opitutales bacterium]|nr:type I restriction endonuclease subunit R [Opitutales bacterium]
MPFTDINTEDRLVQATFAEHLERELGWENIYAWHEEVMGAAGTLGRETTREVVLKPQLRDALVRLNPELPGAAVEDAILKLTRHDLTRSLIQHNQEFYRYLRDGVPVTYRDGRGQIRDAKARVIDFDNGLAPNGQPKNRFVAVRELVIQGLRAPHYNRRADLVCFVNGLPLVFIELKAVYRNIRAAYDGNLRDYLEENSIAHAFHHNAFIVVSNGDQARYGSITSGWEHFNEWKRQGEADAGRLDAEVLLEGMLRPDRLLDIVENFILFDGSKPGNTRKVVARNHQVLGVNRAVDSVIAQEELKREFPPEKRLIHREVKIRSRRKDRAVAEDRPAEEVPMIDAFEEFEREESLEVLRLVEPAHPDLGKLGVFWHTQGSGKSYSMAFFVEKVRRRVSSKFTFLLMTDRTDLDAQIFRTFAGCGVADANAPRAKSGEDLEGLLKENHRFIFSLIHKFNKDVDPDQPYSRRDDIIVISDEAHRTQAGKLARNMRLALPNASFIGFTGTPLFKQDHLTRRIFGSYVSRYDFKRSEEDGSTVKLVYENRGEKLKVARLDLNDKIAAAVEQANLDPDKELLLEKLLGKDYEVVTAPARLEKIADDFVEHLSLRWESGKAMLVCVDKITCARMYQLIFPRWRAKIAEIETDIAATEAARGVATEEEHEKLSERLKWLRGQHAWMTETLIQVIISEAQNEVADFKKWGFDIIPHRSLMKLGFETPDGKRIDVESAFKDPRHPFRVAIVCAMWLTGFDVECLSTLYIDKPLRAHTLMQAIARANRVYPEKDFGLIVDYNGMLKSLREALAQYALGDDSDNGGDEIIAPVEERVQALIEAIAETERHLLSLGFDCGQFAGVTGFDRIRLFRDAEEVLWNAGEGRRRFEILARQVFVRFKSLITDRVVFDFAEQHDNIEKIFKKLQERRDTSDVSQLLKELHKIVNEAIETATPDESSNESRFYDLSTIDLEKLREEFEKKVKRKATALKDIQQVVEDKLAAMLAQNPNRMDFYKKYQEIVADYNKEKDRVTIEETFAKLVDLAQSLDAEQQRAVKEGLSEEELAIFDLLRRNPIAKTERERVKDASRTLLTAIRKIIGSMQEWTVKEQTRAEVEVSILDKVFEVLPSPPFSDEDKQVVAHDLFEFVWSRHRRPAA